MGLGVSVSREILILDKVLLLLEFLRKQVDSEKLERDSKFERLK